MATVGDIQVRLSLDDQLTPALHKIRRQLWWMRYGDRLIGAIIFACGVLAGQALR